LIRIRNGQPEEIHLLQRIEQQAAERFASIGMRQLEITGAAVLEERARQGRLLVAEVDAVAAGFVIFSEVDDSAYIEELDVHPDFAGQRLGARLIDQVEAWANREGLAALTLSTFRYVPWNAPYYARLGFTVITGEIGPRLAAIAREHAAKAFDIAPRVFMRRLLGDG